MPRNKQFADADSMEKALARAEINARGTDREIEKQKRPLSAEEMQLASELHGKAQAVGMKLIPEKRIKNKAKFAQIIQENYSYLLKNDYLKTEEVMFLNKIIGHIGFGSNCIIRDIKSKEQVPMTQTEIAESVKGSRPTVTRLVNQLINKGILGRFESGRDDVNAKMYALYVNPNIIICGDRDNVNATLQTMFAKKPKELKKLPVKIV